MFRGTQQENTAETQEKQQMIKRWSGGHSRRTQQRHRRNNTVDG
jgi:hypothetical protein